MLRLRQFFSRSGKQIRYFRFYNKKVALLSCPDRFATFLQIVFTDFSAHYSLYQAIRPKFYDDFSTVMPSAMVAS